MAFNNSRWSKGQFDWMNGFNTNNPAKFNLHDTYWKFVMIILSLNQTNLSSLPH